MDSTYNDFVPITYRDDLLEGYQINKLGQFKTPEGRILKGTVNRKGYISYNVRLSNGHKAEIQAHRAVASQFIDNPNNYEIVNHLDENKKNPCIDNLQWTDCKTNTNYGTSQIRRGDSRKIPINEYNRAGKYIRTWKSADDFGRYCVDYNVFDNTNKSSIARNITNGCHGKTLFPFNKIWRYYSGNIDDITDISQGKSYTIKKSFDA